MDETEPRVVTTTATIVHPVRDELIVTVLSTLAGMATSMLVEICLKKVRARRKVKIVIVPDIPPTPIA